MVGSDEERFRERRQRISEILADIAGHAQSVSVLRCPYKNKPGECTAQFRCRNQRPSATGGPLLCGHDGTFDYRVAWETRPETYDRTREKLRRIREEAARRRREADGTQGGG
jgi:hypothetical protein